MPLILPLNYGNRFSEAVAGYAAESKRLEATEKLYAEAVERNKELYEVLERLIALFSDVELTNRAEEALGELEIDEVSEDAPRLIIPGVRLVMQGARALTEAGEVIRSWEISADHIFEMNAWSGYFATCVLHQGLQESSAASEALHQGELRSDNVTAIAQWVLSSAKDILSDREAKARDTR